MTVKSVPHTTFALAGELEDEVQKLKSCIGLINQTLLSIGNDAEQVERGQNQLSLLMDIQSGISERLSALTAAAYDLGRVEKAAA